MTRARTILDRLVAEARHDGFGLLSMHVRVGDDAAERHLGRDVPRDVHSVAKAVCVLAVGLASDEGIFDVDAPVVRYLDGWSFGPGAESVTTRHLLQMTSGIDLPWSPSLFEDWPDLAVEYLGRPSVGRSFQYSNASTYTAMRALGAVVGDVHAWLGPRLFDPLAMRPPGWDRCPRGWIKAGEGLHLRLGELARLGRLIRDDGVHEGERLVSATWPRAMHAGWFVREAGVGYTHYALAGWGGPGRAWRLHGAHGQMVIFVDDAVVTIVADDHVGADLMALRVADALEPRAT